MLEDANHLYAEAPIWRGALFGAGFFTLLAFAQLLVVPGRDQTSFASLPPPIPTGPGSYASPYPQTPVLQGNSATAPPVLAAPASRTVPTAANPVPVTVPLPTSETMPAKAARPLVDTSELTDAPPLPRKGHAEAPGSVNSLKPRPLVIPQ